MMVGIKIVHWIGLVILVGGGMEDVPVCCPTQSTTVNIHFYSLAVSGILYHSLK